MSRLRSTLQHLLFLDRPRRREGVFGVVHGRRSQLETLVEQAARQVDDASDDDTVREVTVRILEVWTDGRPAALMDGGLSWSGRGQRAPLPPDAPHSSLLAVNEPGTRNEVILRVRVGGILNDHGAAPPVAEADPTGGPATLCLPAASRGGPATESLPNVQALLASRAADWAAEILAELDLLRQGPSARPFRPAPLTSLIRHMDEVLGEEIACHLPRAERLLQRFQAVREALVPVAETLAELEETRWEEHLAPARAVSWREAIPEEGVLLVHGPNSVVLETLAERSDLRFDLAFLDPPYNTRSSLRRYADSRSSSDWLTLIASTVCTTTACLHDTALVFTCIDDNEVSRMRLLLEELRLHELSCVVVKMSELSGPKMKHAHRMYPRLKEYVLVHGRTRNAHVRVPRQRKDIPTLARYCRYYTRCILNPDEPVESWNLAPIGAVMTEEGVDPDDDDARLQWQIENAARLVYRTNNRAIAHWRASHPDAPEITTVEGPGGRTWIAWGERELLRLSDFLDAPLGDLWLDISTINLRRELMGLPAYRGGQKPLALVERVLQSVPQENLALIDPWAGSGTSGHAALNRLAAGRPTRALLIESSPEAFALAHERLRRAAEHLGLSEETVRTLDLS